MTDDAPVIEQLNSVHIFDAISQSISTDGTTAMMVFMVGGADDDAPLRKFAITFPLSKTCEFINMFYELELQARRAGKSAGGSILHFPMTWAIGHDKELDARSFVLADHKTPMPAGGKIAITFDQMSFVLMNLPGIELAQTLRDNIIPRLTDEEREKLIEFERQKRLASSSSTEQ